MRIARISEGEQSRFSISSWNSVDNVQYSVNLPIATDLSLPPPSYNPNSDSGEHLPPYSQVPSLFPALRTAKHPDIDVEALATDHLFDDGHNYTRPKCSGKVFPGIVVLIIIFPIMVYFGVRPI